MEEISREYAEQLFQNYEVVQTQVIQDHTQLTVRMTLSNNLYFTVSYVIPEQRKHYYIDQQSSGLNIAVPSDPMPSE